MVVVTVKHHDESNQIYEEVNSESRIYQTNEGGCQALDKWPTIRAVLVGERDEFVKVGTLTK